MTSEKLMKQAAMWVRVCGVLLAAATVSVASAQTPDRGYRPGGRAPEHMDARFAHNHYYPNRGAYVAGLPGRPYAFDRPGGRFFYSGGVWYAPYGPRFVVVGAPLGVFVPVLPPFYNTIWFGGVPYYYANDTYYQWVPDQNQYEVVQPPGDDSAAQMQPGPAAQAAATTVTDDVFIYPKNGQSDQQQATDKYECHKWANQQSGFDPTQSGGGVPPEQNASAHAAYSRAMGACLEGRGYSVK